MKTIPAKCLVREAKLGKEIYLEIIRITRLKNAPKHLHNLLIILIFLKSSKTCKKMSFNYRYIQVSETTVIISRVFGRLVMKVIRIVRFIIITIRLLAAILYQILTKLRQPGAPIFMSQFHRVVRIRSGILSFRWERFYKRIMQVAFL